MFSTTRPRSRRRTSRVEKLEIRELMAADLMAMPVAEAPAMQASVAEVATIAGMESATVSVQEIGSDNVNGRSPDKDGKGCTEHGRPHIGSPGPTGRPQLGQAAQQSETSDERYLDIAAAPQDTEDLAAIDEAFAEQFDLDADSSNDEIFGKKKDPCRFKKRRYNKRTGLYH